MVVEKTVERGCGGGDCGGGNGGSGDGGGVDGGDGDGQDCNFGGVKEVEAENVVAW